MDHARSLVAVVAGATRGAGRGIARGLGEQGATVYCVGRSIPGSPGMKNRPETIQETADLVTAAGGRGIPLQADFTVPEQAARAFDQVGEIDVLVNDIWGGDDLVEWGKKLWETRLEDGLTLIDPPSRRTSSAATTACRASAAAASPWKSPTATPTSIAATSSTTS